jgi:hypothetical protein
MSRFKYREEDEADYAMFGRIGNLPCFLPIKTFLNVIEPDAFKDKLEIIFYIMDSDAVVV